MFDQQGYRAYLASEEWQAKHAEYSASGRDQRCYVCRKERQRNFQLHHLTYEHLYNEPLDDLVPVCRPCHVYVHKLEKRMWAAHKKLTLRQVTDLARHRRMIRRWIIRAVGAVVAVGIGVFLAQYLS